MRPVELLRIEGIKMKKMLVLILGIGLFISIISVFTVATTVAASDEVTCREGMLYFPDKGYSAVKVADLGIRPETLPSGVRLKVFRVPFTSIKKRRGGFDVIYVRYVTFTEATADGFKICVWPVSPSSRQGLDFLHCSNTGTTGTYDCKPGGYHLVYKPNEMSMQVGLWKDTPLEVVGEIPISETNQAQTSPSQP